jgi:hypothetical protein
MAQSVYTMLALLTLEERMVRAKRVPFVIV